MTGNSAGDFGLLNEFLAHLADRNYSPRTRRAYAFDLLHFARWLLDEGLSVDGVSTDVLLRYLAVCRSTVLPGQHGGNVVPIRRGWSAGYAPATINRRLAAISSLFGFRALRDPAAASPVPLGAARRPGGGQRTGELAHLARPQPRSRLRVRQPRRLPRGWTGRRPPRCWPASAATGTGPSPDQCCSPDCARPRCSGWRSATSTSVAGGRVVGKGDKERRVPLDAQVAGLLQTYLLVERPDTTATALFVVTKAAPRAAAHPGRAAHDLPLPPGESRCARGPSACAAAHLRHRARRGRCRPGRAAELMGHDHIDSSAAYIHLAPTHVRAQYDAARDRLRVGE